MTENNAPLVAMISSAKQPEPENFLAELLPVNGPFWMLAYPRGSGMAHESFDSVDMLAARIKALDARGVEVWYGVASFMHRHDEAIEGGKACWGRKKENAACITAFFLDIDVNPDKPGKAYTTIEDAEQALARFEAEFGERCHCLVHSGGGFPPFHHEVINVPMTPRALWSMGVAGCHHCHHLFLGSSRKYK